MAKTANLNGIGSPANTASFVVGGTLDCHLDAPSGVAQYDGTQPMGITDIRLYLGGGTSCKMTVAGKTSSTVSTGSGNADTLTAWAHFSSTILYGDSTGSVVSTLELSSFGTLYYGWSNDSGNTIHHSGATEKSGASLVGDITYYTGTTAARSVTIVALSPTSVKVSWTDPSDLGGYPSSSVWAQVWIGTDAGISQNVKTLTTSLGANSATFTGLTPGTRYYALVRCINNISSWAGTYSVNSNIPSVVTADVPDAPAAPTVSVTGSTTATISWTTPGNGGSAITGYTVQYSTLADFTNANTLTTGVANSMNVTGLTPGTTYYWHIAASNAGGLGPYSSSTSATQYSVPSAPQSVVVDPSTDSADLSWVAPASNGGTPITGYQIQHATLADFSNAIPTSTSGTSATVTGLAPGTSYYWRVQAVNAAGNGAWSATQQITQLSGGEISDGAAWNQADLYVSDGAQWLPAVVLVSDGTNWLPGK